MEDSGFSQLCMQVLLTHFGAVRSPAKDLPEHHSRTSILSEGHEIHHKSQGDYMQGDRLNSISEMRNAVFWMGVGCDTRTSLINQTPMVIARESVLARLWDFTLQRTDIFQSSFRALQRSPGPLSSKVVVVILENATAYKTMHLSTINQFCDTLFQCDTESMTMAAQRLSYQCLQFREVYEQLLALCGREYLTLSVESRLNYGTNQSASSINDHDLINDSSVECSFSSGKPCPRRHPRTGTYNTEASGGSSLFSSPCMPCHRQRAHFSTHVRQNLP